LAASSRLTVAPNTLWEFIDDLPAGSKILLRRGLKSMPGLFERTMAAYCTAEEVNYEWVMPDPLGGREATFLRDVEFARRADLVLCFFADEHMEGGTEHVVEKAFDAGTPVYSWGYNGKEFMRIGEHDPDNLFGQLVPWV
jgi:hypothetical protein